MLLSEARMPEMGGGEIWMRSKGETGARSEVLGVCGVQRARGGPWRACDDGEARTVQLGGPGNGPEPDQTMGAA